LLQAENRVFVSTLDEFKEALAQAVPGVVIIVKAGDYTDWSVDVTLKGTPENPIVVRAAEPTSILFYGNTHMVFSGEWFVIRGFHYWDCTGVVVELKDARHARLSDCRFYRCLGQDIIRVSGDSIYNRIDYCTFEENLFRHIAIRTVGAGPTPMYTLIDHNLFADVKPKPNGNGCEAIQIGQNPMGYGRLRTFVWVYNNVFRNFNGEPEVISNKASSNLISHNEFTDCAGELVMRGGHDVGVIGNTFDRCGGGIRVSGSHHLIVNNRILNAVGTDLFDDVPNPGVGIRLQYGSSNFDPAYYLTATDCLISNNVITAARFAGLQIGSLKNDDLDLRFKKFGYVWNDHEHGTEHMLIQPPRRNRFFNNEISAKEGTMVLVEDAPENTLDANLIKPTDNAVAGLGITEDPVMTPIIIFNTKNESYPSALGISELSPDLLRQWMRQWSGIELERFNGFEEIWPELQSKE
jgi:hypothetical protein